jgi:hypothetical protein
MHRIHPLLYCLLLLVLVVTGCDLYPQDDYEQYYVVESYLVANRVLPQVRVTHTLPVEEEFSLNEVAVTDASVQIRLLDENDAVEEIYEYGHQSNGVYLPLAPEAVLPLRRYELRVTIPQSDDVITARTLVPGSFETVGEVVDSIAYQSTDQIIVNTTRSEYPDRQAFFIFTVNAVNPSAERLTPFYKDQVEDEEDLSSFYINSSGIINEGNYDINPDGTLTLRIPWLAVAFYGYNDITANAIDDNMYDFLRSQNAQAGGTTLPPGEIQNIRYHVNGGIGVFGSLASDTVRVFITRQ